MNDLDAQEKDISPVLHQPYSSDAALARMREQYGEVFEAIEVLCKHIKAYRQDEVSICWSNGITLRVNGFMQAGGMNNVAKWIREHSEKA